jgi:predicted dehydrogenase
VKIALVGNGYWGSKLLRNLVTLVGPERVVVADPSEARLAAATASFPSIGSCGSMDAALEDPDVGAVVLATPVTTHAELAEAAIVAGRDVLVEKPLTSSVESSRRLVRLADEHGVVLMVGHTFLFSPRVQWIASYLRNGGADQIHYLTSSRLNLGIHRSDVNVIWDLAPHDFSVVFHLLDEFPSTISTSTRSIVHPGHPDTAFMNMTFPSGVIAEVAVSWLAPRKVRTLTLVADSGMIVYDDVDPEEPVKIHDRGVVIDDSADFGLHQLTYRYGDTRSPHIPVEEPLALQLGHFEQAIRERTAPISDGRFGLHVVAALDAADRSWRDGGSPVAVDAGIDQLAARE